MLRGEVVKDEECLGAGLREESEQGTSRGAENKQYQSHLDEDVSSFPVHSFHDTYTLSLVLLYGPKAM